jgi:Hydrazine synthase alpha subunit middle domain
MTPAASLAVLTGLVAVLCAAAEAPVVLTEIPAGTRFNGAAPYPDGSRVALTDISRPGEVRILSEGLDAAGGPVVAADGRRIFYAARPHGAGEWQIFQSDIAGGRPRQVTTVPGGAAHPALLRDGSVVFVSPAAPAAAGSAIYVQPAAGPPQRLSFASGRITGETVLGDGRILFAIDARPGIAGPELFTMNNDGTEVTAFAARLESGTRILVPRELPDRRATYQLASADGTVGAVLETIRMARPFASRSRLHPTATSATAAAFSASGATNGSVLICDGALHRLQPGESAPGTTILEHPGWTLIEAVELAPHAPPMGRLSTVDPTKHTGHILCLDADNSADAAHPGSGPKAVRLRILGETAPGIVRPLGEAPVEADGSVMIEAPSNVPLGFETLDAKGAVIHSEPPFMWVRPGENRACTGCHEPRNHSPQNRRSLAVTRPQVRLTLANPPATGGAAP